MSAIGRSGRGKVLAIELFPSVPNLGRFIVMPRYGLLTVASIVADRTDYDVKFLFEPYVGKLNAEVVEREEPRFLLVNGLTTSAHDNERFLRSVRERLKKAVPVIAGGEHATMFPEDAKGYADYILAYEGDDTVVPLLAALEEEDPLARESLLSQIPGLHYRDLSGKWRFNRVPARVERIDYRYDFSIVPGAETAGCRFRTAHMPLQTSRGCRFCCSFCTWIGLYGKSGYVVRPIDDVVHDIAHTIEYTGVTNFMVADNLFAGDAAYAEELLGSIAGTFERAPRKPRFTVLCRADQFAGGPAALPDRVVRLMARAGVCAVSLGLESISSRSLLQMRKRSTLEQYYAAAERLRRQGIGMLATFVAGFDGDTYEDVVNIAEFGERLGLFTVQVYARSIAPDTVDDYLSERRNMPGGLHKYRNGHAVNIFPALMLPSDLQRAMFEASFRFHKRDDPGRKLALRAFHAIWNALAPHYEGLVRIERELLIPTGIYRPSGSGYLLDEKVLDSLAEDAERYRAFADRCGEIFAEADRAAGGRRDLSPGAAAIA